MSILKYSIAALLIALIGYNSVYIKPLDEVKKAATQQFDAAAFARTFLAKTLPPALEKATLIQTLIALLASDKDKTFSDLSHAVSIGNIRNFLVKGEGKITKINDDEIVIASKGLTIHIATEFIYGNAIRDAAGLFDIKQFTNTADINNVASEINKIIRTEVVPKFKKQAKVGDTIQFVGALEMNQEHIKIDNFEVLPIILMMNEKR